MRKDIRVTELRRDHGDDAAAGSRAQLARQKLRGTLVGRQARQDRSAELDHDDGTAIAGPSRGRSVNDRQGEHVRADRAKHLDERRET